MLKRNKYDYKFRLECVELVVKKRQATIRVAKEKGIPYTNLRLWVGFYNKYGRDGLKGRENKHYDASFKFKVLQTIDKELLSLQDACVRFDIAATSSIISWRDAYKSNGYQGLISKPKGRPPKMKPPIKRKLSKPSKPLTREQELLEELEYLRAENALLKKLQALAQVDKKQKPSSS